MITNWHIVMVSSTFYLVFYLFQNIEYLLNRRIVLKLDLAWCRPQWVGHPGEDCSVLSVSASDS